MNNFNAPAVGLLHLPHLQAALTACGVVSAGGEDFYSAAKAITAAGREHPKMPLLLADYAGAGQTPWLEKWVTRTRTVIVLLDTVSAGLGVEESPIGGNTSTVPRVAAPVLVAELLAMVGVPCPAPLASAFLAPDGMVMVPEPVAQPSPANWGQPQLPAAPAPAQPAPASSPAEAPQAAAPIAPPAPAAVALPAAPQPTAATVALPVAQPAPAAPPVGAEGAHTIMSIAGKGGVGKSMIALTLAERAARVGGLRVAVIDGNRGQGDLRTYLRLARAPLPTVYDVAAGADPASVIVRPDQIAANRLQSLDRIHFAVALAPLEGMAEKSVVTSGVYGRVLEVARSMADLVVVDTQIAESSDTSGLFDDLWIPALVQYAHMVGITNLNAASIENLSNRVEGFRDAGVATDNISIVLNDAPHEIDYNQQRISDHLATLGWLRGRVAHDESIIAANNTGEVPWDHAVLAPVLDQILFAVTGLAEFAPKPAEANQAKRRRGLFGLGR